MIIITIKLSHISPNFKTNNIQIEPKDAAAAVSS